MTTFVEPPTADLDKPAGIGKLNGFLGSRSYVYGYAPTQADVALFTTLSNIKLDEKRSIHVGRFMKHMNAFSEAERS